MQPAGAVPFRPENQYVGLVPLQLYTRKYNMPTMKVEAPWTFHGKPARPAAAAAAAAADDARLAFVLN
jgi:hypothetical protein